MVCLRIHLLGIRRRPPAWRRRRCIVAPLVPVCWLAAHWARAIGAQPPAQCSLSAGAGGLIRGRSRQIRVSRSAQAGNTISGLCTQQQARAGSSFVQLRQNQAAAGSGLVKATSPYLLHAEQTQSVPPSSCKHRQQKQQEWLRPTVCRQPSGAHVAMQGSQNVWPHGSARGLRPRASAPPSDFCRLHRTTSSSVVTH